MISDQLELLEIPEFLRRPIARRSDPVTSKKAAVVTDATTRIPDKQKLLELVRELPGHTTTEYADVLERRGMKRVKAQRMPSRRMSDLLKDGSVYAGKARTCKATGFAARPYFPTKEPRNG